MMRLAVCDPLAFYPLQRLVSGPFDALADLNLIERFIRTVVLHDGIAIEPEPLPQNPAAIRDAKERAESLGFTAYASYDPNHPQNRTPDASQVVYYTVVAVAPSLAGFDFIELLPREVPSMTLAPSLIDLAHSQANAGDDSIYFQAHVEYLKRVLGVVERGGSALLCGEFGQRAISTAGQYPESLFHELDDDWKEYARRAESEGLGLRIPPVLGIVLTRCARRDAIPSVIRDLRDEWAGARKKVWNLLDALRVCQTLGEAVEIRKELADASRLFSPESTELDSRPVRILWEIVAAGAAGAGIAALSGGGAVIGAVTGAITQAARNVPAFSHEFGAMIFGRGAFDLARRVRRAVSQVERDALPRLLTDAEKRNLGFN